MAHDDEVAETRDGVADIGDHPGNGRHHLGACGYIDSEPLDTVRPILEIADCRTVDGLIKHVCPGRNGFRGNHKILLGRL